MWGQTFPKKRRLWETETRRNGCFADEKIAAVNMSIIEMKNKFKKEDIRGYNMKEQSVEITKENLLEFVESLKDRLKVSKKDIMKGIGTFDKRARTFFANEVRKWFHHRFDVAPEDYVFVEGDEYNIAKEYRKHKFFNSPTNPDAAIIAKDIPFKIAIELDHGNYGSNVRMALAKASYSVLLGKTYDQAVVLSGDGA